MTFQGCEKKFIRMQASLTSPCLGLYNTFGLTLKQNKDMMAERVSGYYPFHFKRRLDSVD